MESNGAMFLQSLQRYDRGFRALDAENARSNQAKCHLEILFSLAVVPHFERIDIVF